MKKSIATVSLGGSLREKLIAISRAGFDGYELFENDLIACSMRPEEVAAFSEELGLSLELYQPFRDFEGVSPAIFASNMRRAEAKFELMNRLGAEMILVCSNVATAESDSKSLVVEQLGALAELASSFGIKVAYEALAWGKYISTYDRAWEIVSEVQHDSLGICLDSFHILSRGSSLDLITRIPGEKVFFAQLADSPNLNLDVLNWSRHHRLFPGEGIWDIPSFVQILVSSGYQGPLSLEIFNDVHRQGSPTLTARDAHRSLVALEDAAARKIGVTQTEFPLLANPPVTQGFSFIEIQPGEGDDARTALKCLGFGLVGRHVRKPVELWQQGLARIILNETVTEEHPSIVGIGLSVDNLTTAKERARQLELVIYPRDRLEAEAELLAIDAPNDVNLFLCQDFGSELGWVSEFTSEADAPQASNVISSVDHVALRQPWQRADEAALFYRAALGLEIEESFDLASEFGLVKSKSLANKDRSLRLALNVTPLSPDSTQTFADHIALRTRNIFEAAEMVETSGLHILPVPLNYFEDLEARTEMDEEGLYLMKKYSILYDESNAGCFYHFYVQPIGSFFFELVQRVSAYDGYGANNAFVRMSAQRSIDLRRPVS